MAIVPMKEARLVVTVDDLDFGIRNVAFEAKVFNRYGTFDRIANRNMEDQGYAYLHCGLLDRVALAIITLRVKSPYIEMHEQHSQKGMFRMDSIREFRSSIQIWRFATIVIIVINVGE
jgi:hypothetical protein